jgi:hypothetical protein
VPVKPMRGHELKLYDRQRSLGTLGLSFRV